MLSPLLQIGVVVRPHALRGQLRVRLHNPASCALDRVSAVWLLREIEGSAPSPEASKPWQLLAAKGQPDGCYLISLAGLTDRNAAEALQGTQVFVRRDDLASLDADEVYLADLRGMSVRTVGGDELGNVAQIQDLNGNTLLCVTGTSGGEILLPAVPHVMLKVDFANGIVVVDPPEGLLGA